jgi:hypothetical protein
MTADTPGTWPVKNGEGNPASATNTNDLSGNLTPQFAGRTAGGPVEVGNPWPVLDANSAAMLAALVALSPGGAAGATAAGQASQLTALGTLLTAIQALTAEDAGLALASGQASQLTALGALLTAIQALTTQDAGLALASGQATQLTQLQAIVAALTGSLKVTQPGSTGLDFSGALNRVNLPSAVGATIGTSVYGGSGPFAAYILVGTAPAQPTRLNIDVENITGAEVVVVRDDGTAASGSAPTNASWFPLDPGVATNRQGGLWSSTTFKGRVQIWAASASSQPTVMVD